MDQLIFASLSHTHYWYEVGMLKVPAVSKRMDPPGKVASPARGQLNRKNKYFPVRIGEMYMYFLILGSVVLDEVRSMYQVSTLFGYSETRD